MNISQEIKAILKETFSQLNFISARPTTNTSINFHHNFDDRAKAEGLTRKDAEDAYYNGQPGGKPNQQVRLYGGYKISIFYYLDRKDGKPVITSIRKFINYKK